MQATLRFVSFLLLLCTSYLVLAQNYWVENFGEKEGLVQNVIYCVNQDANGIIWIGTDFGLYRYDGIEFINYNSKDGLDDHEVLGVVVLGNGVIVFHTFSGKINYLYNGVIYNEQSDPELKKLRTEKSPTIEVINDSTALITSGGSLEITIASFGKEGAKLIKKIQLSPELGTGLIRTDATDNIILVITGRVISPTQSDFKLLGVQIGSYTCTELLQFSSVAKWVKFTNDSTFLINRGDSVCRFRLDSKGEIRKLGYIRTKELSNIIPIANEEFLTCTNSGVYQYDSLGVIDSFLCGTSVNTAHLDRDSNLWLGTPGNGLYGIFPKDITTCRSAEIKNPNALVLAGYKGLMAFGFDKMSFGVSSGGEEFNGFSIQHSRTESLGRVKDLCFLNENSLFVATDNGLFEYDLLTNKAEELHYQKFKAYKCLVLDGDELWAGSHVSLYHRDLKTGKYKDWEGLRVVSIALDENGFVWFASNIGLYKMEISSGKITPVRGVFENMRINRINYSGGDLYLATGNGVYRLEPNTGRTERIDQGLVGVNCLSVKVHGNDIWVATHSGISKMTKLKSGKYQTKNFTKQDGLSSNLVNDIYIQNDTIWAATATGVCVFREKDIKNVPAHEVNVLELKSGNEVIELGNNVFLKADKRDLTIRFAAAVFHEKMKYAYRLFPGSADWTYTDENTVTFSQLSPGEYTFEVLGINHRGHVSKESTLMMFEVEPFFYETSWFKILIISGLLLGILIVGWGHSKRVRKREKQKNFMDRQLALLELEAIKAQINPHFVYNCLNSIRLSVIKKQNTEAEEQISVFARLIRKTLDFSKLDFVSVSDEREYLEQYLAMEKLRFKQQLEFDIELESGLENTMIPSMLIQPFVENAVKHGVSEEGETPLQISVRFFSTPEGIRCEIEDTGVGIQTLVRKKSNTPHGMALTKTRAETYNTIFGMNVQLKMQDKGTKNAKNHGTLVTIDIPISKNIYKRNESIYNRRRSR